MKTPLLDKSIYNLGIDEITNTLTNWGEPAFRAKQIYEHLYIHAVNDFEKMSNLPKTLRKKLNETWTIGSLHRSDVRIGDEGLTRKALFTLSDGSPLETVLMVYEDRATVCVSSQSGCPMACVFCATGKLGFLHDLNAGQIVEQVLWAVKEIRNSKLETQKLTNVVFMGMGEPFNNYDNWWAAVERLHDPKGFNMGARSFTVSTVGLVPGILRLAQEKLPINLAISLHAPDDALRSAMMPVNKKYPIAELMAATREYTERSGRRVSFEYVLLKEKNDFPEQAEQLAHVLRGDPKKEKPLLCHVNLIPWNPVPGTPLGRSDRQRVLAFQNMLKKFNVPCTVRVERGVNIAAACGQLAGNLT